MAIKGVMTRFSMHATFTTCVTLLDFCMRRYDDGPLANTSSSSGAQQPNGSSSNTSSVSGLGLSASQNSSQWWEPATREVNVVVEEDMRAPVGKYADMIVCLHIWCMLCGVACCHLHITYRTAYMSCHSPTPVFDKCNYY